MLLWSAHFERATGAPVHERKHTQWLTRQRYAEQHGQPFEEEPPKSPTELTCEREGARVEALLRGAARTATDASAKASSEGGN